MKTILASLIGALVLLPAFASPSAAQGHDERHEREEHRAREEHRGREEHREAWHGDIHRFREHDFDRWRGGAWFHGNHDGRFGWWWQVGPSWYFYPAPVYPYPDPYVPPAMAGPAPAARYWYYCPNPQGYYPYVPQCFTPWQPVPAG